MKQKLSYLMLALCLLHCSCDKTPQFIPEMSVTCKGVVLETGASTEVQSGFKGDMLTIKVSTNSEWSAVSDVDWIELNPAEGASGVSPLKITVSENPQFDLREGRIQISLKSYREVSCSVIIKQGSDQAFINAYPVSLEFDEDGGGKDVTVESNCDWTADASASWITLSPNEGGKGNGTLKITLTENTSSEIRTANVVVSNSKFNLSQSISISQNPDLSDYYIDEYGKNRGKGILIGSTTWAPVNCGYKEASDDKPGNPYGKFYQWGRSSGFGYNTDAIEEEAIAINVDGPVASADVALAENFYKNGSNWLSANVNDLWNTGSESVPVKTQYDPCPDGWRVPTATELKSLAANGQRWLTSTGADWTENSGLKHWGFSGSVAWAEATSKIYLPLGGWIATGSNAKDRGTGAFYWSSSCSADGKACGLQAWANWNDKDFSTEEKARGCNVRCVKE